MDDEREKDETVPPPHAAAPSPLLAVPLDPNDDEADGFAADGDPTDDDPTAVDPAIADDVEERLRDLVVYLATNLTDDPDAVEVVAERRGQNIHLNLRVAEDELGKVIGRQGRIARAMRTALTIAGSRHNVRATLDIDD